MDSDLLFSLLTIAVLLIISGFFSGSETGLTAITRARIHNLEKEGSKRAAMVSILRERKERLIGTILLGNNLVNIAASALATSVAIELFGFEGVAVATLVMTLLVLIFAEVLPKTYAINNPDRVALAVAPIMVLLVRLMFPVTLAVQHLVQGVFQLFGVKVENDSLVSASDAIRGAIEMHHKEGEMIKQDRDMLGSILDLGDVEVGEIMIHRKKMVTIDVALPVEDIVNLVLESPFTRIPLWRDSSDNIVGVLHVKDLLRAIRRVGDMGALDIVSLASEPWFIPEHTTLRAQLHAFREKRNHFAIVVDEYGSIEGIVTLEDILEEIVGQIDDEHDRQISGIRPQLDGSVIVDGTVTLRDLKREYDWELPDEHASTVAGLLMHETRTIPEITESFEFFGFIFTVLQRQGNQITRIRIEVISSDDAAN